MTLGTILSLSVTTLGLQAIPSLHLQAVAIIVWMIARFFMYARCAPAQDGGRAAGGARPSFHLAGLGVLPGCCWECAGLLMPWLVPPLQKSRPPNPSRHTNNHDIRSYFAIFGALFGFRNFGRLVAVDNLFNGLFGLLQYPLTYLAIHPLNGNFMWVNIVQVCMRRVVGGGGEVPGVCGGVWPCPSLIASRGGERLPPRGASCSWWRRAARMQAPAIPATKHAHTWTNAGPPFHSPRRAACCR